MLTPFDWTIIVVYLLAMVIVGVACRGSQHTSGDYFVGKNGLSGFLGTAMVGLSLAASFFSGITFLVYPALVYSHGLLILWQLPPVIVVWFLLRHYFLPRYLSGEYRMPYDVLEMRWDSSVRKTAALLFVGARIGWMGTLIYAPTTAVLAATGLGDDWFWPTILIIGLTSTLYTTIGGIRGVIVTDAIQFLIITVAVVSILLFIFLRLPIPAGDALGELHGAGRLEWLKPQFSLTEPLTFWAVVIGAALAKTSACTGDQMSLQRYLALGDPREVMRSFLVNIVGVVIVLTLLAAVGVALAAWYMVNNDPGLPKSADQIMPYFVARELPAGIAGLLLAAILAATMSSITSGVNALAGSLTADFGRVPGPPADELSRARWTSLLTGLIATTSAGLVSWLGGIFEIAQKLLGVFLTPLGICLLLSVSTLRVTSRVMRFSLLAGCATGWVFALMPTFKPALPSLPAIDALWVGPISAGVTTAIALLFAMFKRTADVTLLDQLESEAAADAEGEARASPAAPVD